MDLPDPVLADATHQSDPKTLQGNCQEARELNSEFNWTLSWERRKKEIAKERLRQYKSMLLEDVSEIRRAAKLLLELVDVCTGRVL